MHDRTPERREMRRLLERGRSLQMFAERRIGKTFLLRALENDLRAVGWTVAFVDVEGMRSEEELLKDLASKLEAQTGVAARITAHLKQRLKNLIGGGWDSTPVQALGSVDAKDFSFALVEAVAGATDKAVIMVDEVALFVLQLANRDRDAAHDFLYHVRRLQQAFPNVRWILTGSIGLDVVGRRFDLLGALVDFETFVLKPFDEAQARSFLDHYCRDGPPHGPFHFEEDALRHLTETLGWLSPYYLRLVADRVRPTGTGPGQERLVTIDDVERAFAAVLASELRTHFIVWEEHIDKNFPADEARQLHAILSRLSAEAQGESVSTLHAALVGAEPTLTLRLLKTRLQALETGGFVCETPGRWRFRSGLLRRYWLRYVAE